jgi:hypothetical protein
MTVHVASSIVMTSAESSGGLYELAVADLLGIAALELPLEERLEKFTQVANGVTRMSKLFSHQCEVAVVFVATQCLDMYRLADIERRAQNPWPQPIDAWPLICTTLQASCSESLRVGMNRKGVFHQLCTAIVNAPAAARRPIFDTSVLSSQSLPF